MTCISENPSYCFEENDILAAISTPSKESTTTPCISSVRNSTKRQRQQHQYSPHPQEFNDLLLRQLKFQLFDLKSAATEAINTVRELVNQLNELAPKSCLELSVSSEKLVVDTERCVDDYYNKFCLESSESKQHPEDVTDLMTSYLGHLIELISKLSVATLELEQQLDKINQNVPDDRPCNLEQIQMILDEMEQQQSSCCKKRKSSEDDSSYCSLLADQMSLLMDLRRCA